MNSDSLTTVDILAADSAHAAAMQIIHDELHQCVEFTEMAPQLVGGHAYGEANPFANLASRGRFDELRHLCAALGTSERRILVPPQALALVERVRGRCAALATTALDSAQSAASSSLPTSPHALAYLHRVRERVLPPSALELGTSSAYPELAGDGPGPLIRARSMAVAPASAAASAHARRVALDAAPGGSQPQVPFLNRRGMPMTPLAHMLNALTAAFLLTGEEAPEIDQEAAR